MSAGSEDEVGDGDKENEVIPEEHDIESLRLAQEEARTVLNHQVQTFTDVDNKAARTFRLDAIILGLIVTATSFIVRTESFELRPYINIFTVSAVIALILSFIAAVITYTSTEIETGVGPAGIERLISKRYTEKEWLILLLRSEAQWMRENEDHQSTNVRYLSLSHGALIVAVLLFFLGIVSVHV